ncbi:MAG TPA: ferrous iron transport protein A [Planctomycetaceae bacterium]|nr:ferrous iron transport protein A [Planctomycetaceae bacterium]HRF02930.1 FeoA family protein [Pirellulaceae bacterium]
MSSEILPLRCVKSGCCVRVDCVVGAMEQIRRLAELGIRQGSDVTVVHAGSPCLLKVGRTKLSFRDGDGASIFVREAV